MHDHTLVSTPCRVANVSITRRRAVTRTGSALTFALLLATACGSSADSTPEATSPSPSSASPGASSTGATGGYPVSIDNCGRTLTFDAPPQRVISLWQAPTEMVLALGAGKDMIGRAGDYGTYPTDLTAAATAVPTLGTGMGWPSRETVLSQEPDLVLAQVLEGFSFDTSSGYASVQEIEQGGAQVYGANACDLDEIRAMTVDTPMDTLKDLGKIFDKNEQAATIIAAMQAQKKVVTDAVAGRAPVKTAFYQGGTGPVHVLADGIYDDEIKTAGGINVFTTEADISNEEFSSIDADVILVGTYEGQDFATQKAFLQKTFPDIPAVKNDRLVELPIADTDASLRVMDGLTRIAAGLHPEAGLTVPSE